MALVQLYQSLNQELTRLDGYGNAGLCQGIHYDDIFTVDASGEPTVSKVDPLPTEICRLYLRRLGSETPKTRVFSEVKHGTGKT